MAPKEIWCNESQERYVLSIDPQDLGTFAQFCQRERCPYAVVGVVTPERRLLLEDPGQDTPVDMPMDVLLGKPPRMHRQVSSVTRQVRPLDLTGVELQQAIIDVLCHPTVASKRF